MSREGALWIGGLEPYMDEDFLKNALSMMGEENVISIKVIKNKFTGEPASYGFINFDSDPAALMAMHKLNGKIIPNSTPPVRFKLNHQSTRLMPGEKDYSVWVGDLTPDVDDLSLFKFFSARFQSVKSAKVVLDGTGFSKGYGFIRFGNEQEQQTSLISMMGIAGLGGKPIKVSIAVPKAKLEAERGFRGGGGSGPHPAPAAQGSIADNLPPSALASLVSKVSGNPNAGAAVVAEAQNQEYQAYWQQYQQQWSQWAAWNQYSQQMAQQQQQQQQQPPPLPQEKGEEEEQKPKSVGPGESIFDGDEMDLVEHSEKIDVEAINEKFLEHSEELWNLTESSRWVGPIETS